GLVGPNAAGKTTLAKIILGLTSPAAGTIEIAGTPVCADESHRSRIDYMPQLARFPDNLSARELFSMLTDLRAPARDLDEELIERFSFEGALAKPIPVLSGGPPQ